MWLSHVGERCMTLHSDSTTAVSEVTKLSDKAIVSQNIVY